MILHHPISILLIVCLKKFTLYLPSLSYKPSSLRLMKYCLFTFCLLFNLLTFSQKRIYVTKADDNGRYLNGNSFAYNPGDTLVLKAQQNPFTYFSIESFHGTKDKPLIITNEGGVVNLVNGIAFTSCTFIKLTGTGSANRYGFKIEDKTYNGVGIDIQGRSSNIEVCNVYIHSKTYGFWVKQEGNCADSLQYPNWIISNISIHDNLIVKMGQEGMYLGSTDPNGQRQVNCNGNVITPIPLRLGDIKVYKNIIDSTGRSGIQLSGAAYGNNEIYKNIVMDAGFEFNDFQGNGISLGGYSHAYVYDNIIKNTFALGILVLGTGFSKVEHNHIDSSGYLGGKSANGMAGIMVDTRPTAPPENSRLEIRNNIIGKNTDYSIRMYKTQPTYSMGNIIAGNTGNIKVADGIDWSAGVK